MYDGRTQGSPLACDVSTVQLPQNEQYQYNEGVIYRAFLTPIYEI
jgi:hypothetical protein